jgi:hypothetical protein
MLRLGFILLIAGLYLIGSGCYELFVQAGTSREPTKVSIAELEKAVPANRHLIVTGGRPVIATAVKFYKIQWGTKVSGSEILFIPIADASTAGADHSTPSILLRMTEQQLDSAKAGKKINFQAIEGIRATSVDLENKARQRLVETYGQASVDRMIILDYQGRIGVGVGLGKLAGGIVMVGAVVGAFIFSRKPKQPTAPIPSAVPPAIPR